MDEVEGGGTEVSARPFANGTTHPIFGERRHGLNLQHPATRLGAWREMFGQGMTRIVDPVMPGNPPPPRGRRIGTWLAPRHLYSFTMP